MHRKSQELVASMRDFLFQIGTAVNAAAEFNRASWRESGKQLCLTPVERAASGIPL